jgi:cardiolipin synthase
MDQPTGSAEVGEDRILTLPNVISALRLAGFPVFVWLLFGRDDRLAAAILLAVLGATDWVDGWIARRFHQISTLGKVLDPVADRVILIGGVAAILVDGAVPLWVAVAALLRETLVAAATVTLAALGARRIDVQWTGKAGAFGLMVAFPSFLAAEADTSLDGAFTAMAWVSALPGLVLAYWSLITYVPLARTALAEGRGRQAAQEMHR